MKKLSRLTLLALASILSLTACLTTQTGANSSVTTDVTCAAQCEVQWSDSDTPETIAQARDNSAAYRAICPAKPCKIDQVAVEKIRKFQEQLKASSNATIQTE